MSTWPNLAQKTKGLGGGWGGGSVDKVIALQAQHPEFDTQHLLN